MKIRVPAQTIEISGADLEAFKRQAPHRAGLSTSELRDEIRSIVHQVGEMGLGEQIAQGHEWLEHDKLVESEKAAT